MTVGRMAQFSYDTDTMRRNDHRDFLRNKRRTAYSNHTFDVKLRISDGFHGRLMTVYFLDLDLAQALE